ncbi:MAG: class I SAM-dependent methyltransferase [Firmicutes bacterium]|nr:class I SAM-dependent methyltransferase [Candidatus Fermentithermobacillaceae bacterium]
MDPKREVGFSEGVPVHSEVGNGIGPDRAEVARLLHTCGTPVLDLGSGSGEMAEAIALGGHEVVGIDKSPKAIAIARARVQLPNAKFIQADGTNLPFEECSFAGAVCYLSLHHFRNPFSALDEVLRVLRPGGMFIIVEYHDFLRRLLYAIGACSTRFQAHPLGGFSISSLLLEVYRRFDVQRVVHYPMLAMLVSRKPDCCL